MEVELNQVDSEFIFTNMKDAVCVMDRWGGLIYTNPAARALLDIDDSQLIGQKIWTYIPYKEKNDDLIQLFIDCAEQKMVYHQGYVDYENKAGKIFKLRVSMTSANASNGGIIYIALLNDLTEFIRVNLAFERYTSPEIADFILNNPDGEALGGRQCECSILMSDIRGFTALSTKLNPTDLIKMLNHYFEKMVSIIEKYKGSVIEFLGDGIFVLFGAPKADECHGSHAVACAVEMENAMQSVNEWNVLNGFPALEMGIGINSGIVVVGNIGSRQKTKYGCMGETVNLAGRIQSYTIGGQIYISEYTKNLIDSDLIINNALKIFPKGGTNEIQIFDIRGVGDLNIKGENGEICWKYPKTKIDIIMHLIKDKAVETKEYKAVILALSEDKRYALLQTDVKLLDKQNIVCNLCDNLYAKVIDVKDDIYKICFTSNTEELDETYKKLF